jgi:hypothetical protein
MIIFLCDIFFTTTLEIITAFIISLGLDRYIFKENHINDDNKDTLTLLVETCLFCGIIGVVTYATGIIVRRIPFPLDGIFNYKHSSYEEIKVLSILSVFTLIFCDSVQYKLNILRYRI